MTEKELRKKAMALPLQPGVYIMKNKDKKIIYIGKAKALKNRVSSYFGSHTNHTLKVIRMVENVDDFDYILCDSEFEALVLECSLIKQHRPKYNILLKDDKGYNYIKITKGEFPRISECKRMDQDGATYIGPYTSGFSVKTAVEETLKIFKLPRCSKQFPRDYNKSRPCLNGFMDLCCAPCAGRISQAEYKKNVDDAVTFIKGGSVKAVKEMQKRMEDCAENLQFEEAAKLRDKEKELKDLLDTEKDKWKNASSHDVPEVTAEDIAEVVSNWTGIPVAQITKEESEKILNLEKILHERIVGQDKAVSAIARAIRRSRVGLKNPNRPIGSFIFLGPTGVGKTELCKTLAEAMFGTEDAIIKLDMSEYMEKHTVSKLIGSPPGYVGYDEGGQLTEKIRRKPYSVVLFDEIEKAHPDVFNMLLQILEDGVLTDSKGRKVSFKNAIIIMTSNVGASKITSRKSALGFGGPDNADQNIEELVMEDLKKTFKPEFLNRVDEIIVFNQLQKADIEEIAKRMLKTLAKRLSGMDIAVTFTDAAVSAIADAGFDKVYGARPLRRAIQNKIEDRMSELILEEKIKKGESCTVDFADGCFTFNGMQ